MASIFSKKEMSEEDIKLHFITPAITSKWSKDKLRMEAKITDGRFNLKGNLVVREKAKYADYLLYLNKNYPIAVVEAKDNNHPVSYGIQQAICYAKMMDIPFAYSSNGDGFVEHDFLTGIEREFGMDEFPSEEELLSRYRTESGLSDNEIKIIDQPYYSDQNTYPPRYYQQVAINRTLDAIAKGQNRILLVMATGTGKTYTAFQIVYRLLKSGMKRKVLYLADRNILVDQAKSQDFSPLEKVIHKIDFKNEDKATIGAYQVYFSLYQQLSGNKDDEVEEDNPDDLIERFKELFPNPDFFDLVIVDECHRGSANADSKWKKVLEYFSKATQIGMTATPKETKYTSNISYFGEPVYTYSLKNGIEDGFLAPFRVVNITLDISDGWRPYKGQKDIFGNEIEDRIYNNTDYDYKIIIQDRITQVAEQITKYLKATDRMAKTIVFCPTEEAAERMRVALVNANSDMVNKNPDYVVRITGSNPYGKAQLKYFISVNCQYPVIATTSQLLSTGVDCKMVKLIVLDKNISSMTEFKQIIGRGTRLREKEGKTHFTVMDFRNVTRLFADPSWDGEVEIDPDFDPDKISKPSDGGEQGDDGSDEENPPISRQKPIIDKDGCRVEVIRKVVSVYDTDGKLLRQESITDYTKENVLGECATLDEFIKRWTSSEKKEEISAMLKEKGIDLETMKKDLGLDDVDDFDFICHVAYDQKPLTRKERADNVIRKDFFSKYNGPAKEILEALLDRYKNEGIYEIENTDVLRLNPFQKYGKPTRIVSYFGGKEEYLMAVSELEAAIYSA